MMRFFDALKFHRLLQSPKYRYFSGTRVFPILRIPSCNKAPPESLAFLGKGRVRHEQPPIDLVVHKPFSD